jgi:hypothetical protein
LADRLDRRGYITTLDSVTPAATSFPAQFLVDDGFGLRAGPMVSTDSRLNRIVELRHFPAARANAAVSIAENRFWPYRVTALDREQAI